MTAKPRKKTAKKKPAAKKAQTQKVKAKPLSIWNPSAIVSTMFSSGRLSPAPGTWGSLWGVILFPLFLYFTLYVSTGSKSIFTVAIGGAAVLVLLYSVGIVAIEKYQSHTKTHDGKEIVYDEFFGQILTYSIITIYYLASAYRYNIQYNQDINLNKALFYQFTPFIFFRIFDIIKPYPISRADRDLKGAHGVMIDDVLAAIYAAVCSILVFWLLDS